MEKCLFGIGRRVDCIQNGKHTIMCVLLRCGTLMNLVKWLLLDGTVKSNIGIKQVMWKHVHILIE